jgi:peroxiredoxin
MKSRSFKLFASIAIFLVAIAAISVYQLAESKSLTSDPAINSPNFSAEDSSQQAIPRLAPDFSLKDLDGKVYNLSDYRGKVVVLNFWATWCPPCVKEIPEYVDIQKEFGPKGVQFIGIALDEEGIAKVRPWLAKHPVSYPILFPDAKVQANYGDLSSIPVTFIIDRKGMIRSTYVGKRQKQVVVDTLNKYIAEGAASGSGSIPAGK